MTEPPYINNIMGIKAFLRKFRKKIKEKGFVGRCPFILYCYIIWLLLNLVMCIISVIKPVKVVWLISIRIGHLAYNLDIFLKDKRSKPKDGKEFYCLGIAEEPIANEQLIKMYGRKFKIIRSKLMRACLRPISWMRSTSFFENTFLLYDTKRPYFNYSCEKPELSFTVAEETMGNELLKTMGVYPGSWFICFHSRDPNYLADYYTNYDLEYHNYRDCKIKNYLLAAEYITNRGGYSLRMGKVVKERLLNTNNPRIIDYASEFQSDFGDIYLASHCKFFLGCDTGLTQVPTIFNVPVAVANVIPMWMLGTYRNSDLIIPKKLWSIERKSFLTFREIYNSKLKLSIYSNEYRAAGVEVVENSAEEILDLACEMNERLDGKFKYTEEDVELQATFRAIMLPDHYCYGAKIRIGAKFLRNNKELLL